uniref:Uncharacterized protein n=1 Tax=Megaselia scalaris TaxID=36166 RepID=T1GCT9_MEGSC
DAENIIGNIHNNLGLEEVHANVANQLEDAFRKQREHEAKKAQQNDANPEVLNPTPGENVQNSQPNQRNPEILDPSPPDETEKNFQEMLNSDVENEILLKPKIEEVMSDEPERVTTPAPDNSTSVSDNSTTVASDNSTAVASDNSTTVASDNSTITTSDNSTAVASDNSTIATSDNSTTIAPEKQISLAEIYGQFVEELHKQISIVPKKNAGSNVGEGIDLIEKILFKYQDDMKRPEGVPKEEEGQIMKEIERIKEKYQLDVFDKGSQ